MTFIISLIVLVVILALFRRHSNLERLAKLEGLIGKTIIVEEGVQARLHDLEYRIVGRIDYPKWRIEQRLSRLEGFVERSNGPHSV